MKISLALGRRQTLSRQSAWGCFTTNLALPGFGTLTAGRVSGYPQAVIGLAGFALTTVFAARFFAWYVANGSRLSGDDTDPIGRLAELWAQVRWPLLGIAVFAVAWLWALGSSLRILSEAKRSESAVKEPPRLER